jgi:hypothetical protein
MERGPFYWVGWEELMPLPTRIRLENPRIQMIANVDPRPLAARLPNQLGVEFNARVLESILNTSLRNSAGADRANPTQRSGSVAARVFQDVEQVAMLNVEDDVLEPDMPRSALSFAFFASSQAT